MERLLPLQFDVLNAVNAVNQQNGIQNAQNPETQMVNKQILGSFPRSASVSTVPIPDILSSEMVLLHPELYDEQKMKSFLINGQNGKSEWKPFGTLTVNIRIATNSLNDNEDEVGNGAAAAVQEQKEREKESGDSVVRCRRMKEMEIEIAVINKTANQIEDESPSLFMDRQIGWISMGWNGAEYLESTPSTTLNLSFLTESQFKEMVNLCFMTSSEMEMTSNIDVAVNRNDIDSEQNGADVFNVRNLADFEVKFDFLVRVRFRERIEMEMSESKMHDDDVNAHNVDGDELNLKAIDSDLRSAANGHSEIIGDRQRAPRRCEVVAVQSAFSSPSSVSLTVHPSTEHLERERRSESPFINGFVAMIGGESMQFIDAVGGRSLTLSVDLPLDTHFCGLMVDSIQKSKLKVPSNSTPKSMENEHQNDEDRALSNKLRSAGKRASRWIIRFGGTHFDDENGRSLSGEVTAYNLWADSWTVIGTLSPPRDRMAVTMFYGRACISGGNLSNDNEALEPTAKCEEFSFTDKKWKSLSSLRVARLGHSMCSFGVKPTKLFVTGGQIENGQWTNSSEIYDPQKPLNQRWNEVTPSMYRHYGASCCPWNGAIVVIGGFIGDDDDGNVIGNENGNKETGQELSRGSRCRHCQHYDPLTNQWRALSDSNFEHGAFPAVWVDADDGDLYVASHFVDGENIKYRVEKLHHIDAQWTVVEESGLFKVENTKQILAKSQTLKVDPVRVCCGVSFKMESAE